MVVSLSLSFALSCLPLSHAVTATRSRPHRPLGSNSLFFFLFLLSSDLLPFFLSFFLSFFLFLLSSPVDSSSPFLSFSLLFSDSLQLLISISNLFFFLFFIYLTVSVHSTLCYCINHLVYLIILDY
jgi:hypothetical protein